MDGPALTRRERLILDSIEAELRQDSGLDRKLSTMRARPAWHLPHPLRAWRGRHHKGADHNDGEHKDGRGGEPGPAPSS